MHLGTPERQCVASGEDGGNGGECDSDVGGGGGGGDDGGGDGGGGVFAQSLQVSGQPQAAFRSLKAF